MTTPSEMEGRISRIAAEVTSALADVATTTDDPIACADALARTFDALCVLTTLALVAARGGQATRPAEAHVELGK